MSNSEYQGHEARASRKEPNAFYHTASVTIYKPPADVFSFLIEDLPARYALFSRGRESFDVTESELLGEAAAPEPDETPDDPEVAGHVEIEKVPDSLICCSLYPRGGDFGAAFIKKMSVYYDLEKAGVSETLLTMTSVIQLTNPLVKMLGMIIGVGKLLGNQMTEELNAIKNEIETGEPETGESVKQVAKEVDNLKS